jgi:hypothetical protein
VWSSPPSSISSRKVTSSRGCKVIDLLQRFATVSGRFSVMYTDKQSRHRIPWEGSPSQSSPLSEANRPMGESVPSRQTPIQQRSDYATFSKQEPLSSSSHMPTSPVFTLLSTLPSYLCLGRSSFPSNYFPPAKYNTHRSTSLTWKAIIFVSLIFALFACTNQVRYPYMAPEWRWDHNVYITRNDVQLPHTRISVLAQVVSSQPLRELTEISSRPNRAYARQWGMDYAQFDSGRPTYNLKACFDKVFILNTILDNQNREPTDPLPLWPHAAQVRYDSIILLPPDSIITELDKNLFDLLLPKDKLVAIAGWDTKELNSNSGILLFNLKHKYADTVAKLWWESVLPAQVTCGANNDLGMLITAIAETMEPDEDLDDLIEPLAATSSGYVGDDLIKCMTPSVPGSRTAILMNNFPEARASVQATADAVCYRFYPKCEVLNDI